MGRPTNNRRLERALYESKLNYKILKKRFSNDSDLSVFNFLLKGFEPKIYHVPTGAISNNKLNAYVKSMNLNELKEYTSLSKLELLKKLKNEIIPNLESESLQRQGHEQIYQMDKRLYNKTNDKYFNKKANEGRIKNEFDRAEIQERYKKYF